MNGFNVGDVAEEIPEDKHSTETVRTDNVSVEVMAFTPGDDDPMHSHHEDEVYQVVSGQGKLNVEGDSVDVGPGDVVHLEPGTEHQFHDFEGELVVTVLYGPAKHSDEQ